LVVETIVGLVFLNAAVEVYLCGNVGINDLAFIIDVVALDGCEVVASSKIEKGIELSN